MVNKLSIKLVKQGVIYVSPLCIRVSVLRFRPQVSFYPDPCRLLIRLLVRCEDPKFQVLLYLNIFLIIFSFIRNLKNFDCDKRGSMIKYFVCPYTRVCVRVCVCEVLHVYVTVFLHDACDVLENSEPIFN